MIARTLHAYYIHVLYGPTRAPHTQSHLISLMREMKLFQTYDMPRPRQRMCIRTLYAVHRITQTHTHTSLTSAANQDSILCEKENSGKSALKINFLNSSFRKYICHTKRATCVFAHFQHDDSGPVHRNLKIHRHR